MTQSPLERIREEARFKFNRLSLNDREHATDNGELDTLLTTTWNAALSELEKSLPEEDTSKDGSLDRIRRTGHNSYRSKVKALIEKMKKI